MTRYQAELYHHGIKGQKWGKRNGPPYPLGDEDRSAAEKKAEKVDKTKKNNDNKDDNFKKKLSKKQKIWITIGAVSAGLALAVIGGYTVSRLKRDTSVSSKNSEDSSSVDAVKRIGLQFFAERSDSLEPIYLPKREYAHISSEIMTHCVDQLKTKRVFSKRILHHIYTVRNNFDGTFVIVGKELITGDIYDYLEERKKNDKD